MNFIIAICLRCDKCKEEDNSFHNICVDTFVYSRDLFGNQEAKRYYFEIAIHVMSYTYYVLSTSGPLPSRK